MLSLAWEEEAGEWVELVVDVEVDILWEVEAALQGASLTWKRTWTNVATDAERSHAEIISSL